ncbi:MAG: cytochrome c oxidase subunit 3 [Acidimicrobiales bacterium]
MTDITPYDFIPADVAPAEPARPRLLLLGTALASVAVAMGFMALIGQYVATRAGVIATGERWLPEGVTIPLTQPNFMGLTLAFSVVTIWWSVSAVRNDDQPNAFIAFMISLAFAFAFLAQTAYLLTIMEIEILATDRAVLFFAIIGLHIVLTLVAMGFAIIMMLRTLGGDYTARDYEGVLSSAFFWTTIVFLYGVLWYAIYITK